MKTKLQIIALVATALLFSACSSKDPKQTSLIENPSLLKQSKKDDSVYSYVKKDVDFSKYSSIMVPRITIKGDSENRLHEQLEMRISNYFTDNLDAHLNEIIKNNPGAGSLLLEVSIDSVQVGYEDLKVWQYIPVSLAIKAIGRGTGIEDKDLNVAIALRIKDNATKETLAMAIDTKMKEDIKDIADVTFEDVKPMLDKWINRLTMRFTELSK